MKQIFFFLSVLFVCSISYSQQKPSAYEISTLPEWAQKMYGENPNYFEVKNLYAAYYKTHPFVKSYHTQYYKRWSRGVINYVDATGEIHLPDSVERQLIIQNYLDKQHGERTSSWSEVGPLFVTEDGTVAGHTQSNVQCLAQSLSDPNILYAGTEPGEIFKSTDGGNSWSSNSMSNYFGSGGSQIWGIAVTSIAIHPTNPDIAFAGGDGGIFRTTNGGANWFNVYPQSDFGVNEILVHPDFPDTIFVATEKGFYRSANNGDSWTQLYTHRSYDVKCHPTDASIMYLVKNNPSLEICEFFRSTDFGTSWTLQTAGWYNSTDPARYDGGARLAVTPADPDRVYAYLIGESKADDFGYIGIYRSDDAGLNWTLPNGPAGGPYTDAHPNLAYGYPDWTYHQGFYNCAIMASETDPDQILIGGLNLWRSDDGGSTFSSVAGYVGGPLNIHVDMQDFRAVNGTYWVTTDGGIYRSTDFYTSQPVFTMTGLRGSDYWGFGMGWNEDVLVGGLYHNGNLAYHENYGAGNFLSLGGGEDATGYVNPGNNRKTYFTDIDGKILPLSMTDPVTSFTFGINPNQSYYAAESSEMEFHPNCYNIAYTGYENKLWKSTDGGSSFFLLYEFGTDAADQVKYIEISSSNSDVIYVSQQPSGGGNGVLWKSVDGGESWNQLTIPSGDNWRMLLAINPEDENEITLAYPSGNNGNKIYHSTNGGASWNNITSAILDDESIQSICLVAGTDGGMYCCTEFAIYYRNNTLGTWVLDNAGLPIFFNTNIARVFYRDGKIRAASYGKGIWESNLYEPQAYPIARISVDKLQQAFICDADSFYFEDYSFLNHTNATWEWTFENGSPSTSTLRNPVVFFATEGTHLVTLTITDDNGTESKDSLYIEVSAYDYPEFISEDFQNVFPPEGFLLAGEVNGGQWGLNTDVGGYGASSQSAYFDNFYFDAAGNSSDIRLVYDASASSDEFISFDIAYAPYDGTYSDSLEVLASTDCGQTFTSLYFKGGSELSTAPSISDYFVPTAVQWRTDSVNISAYLGEPELMIAFRNFGYYGNVMYVDNINLGQSPVGISEPLMDQITIFPNPIQAGNNLAIRIPAQYEGEIITVRIFDISGKLVTEAKVLRGLNYIQLPSDTCEGTYLINVRTSDLILNQKLVIR